MANMTSLSKKQTRALLRFLRRKIGKSADALVEEVGQADAFTLILLKQRMEEKYGAEVED